MSALLKDWVDFCTGIKSYDKSHFFSLFMEVEERVELEKVFQFFPGKEKLLDIFAEHSKLKSYDVDDLSEEIIKLAKLDIAQKLDLCKRLNKSSLVKALENVPVSFSAEHKNLNKEKMNSNLHFSLEEFIATYVEQNCELEDEKVEALFEAFYGYCGDYNLCYYFGSPLIKTQLNFEYYYEMRRLRGDYVLKDGLILVICEE